MVCGRCGDAFKIKAPRKSEDNDIRELTDQLESGLLREREVSAAHATPSKLPNASCAGSHSLAHRLSKHIPLGEVPFLGGSMVHPVPF